jgi:hypothetical protein
MEPQELSSKEEGDSDKDELLGNTFNENSEPWNKPFLPIKAFVLAKAAEGIANVAEKARRF